MTKYCISCFKKFSNTRFRYYTDIHMWCLDHGTWKDEHPSNIDSFYRDYETWGKQGYSTI